MAIPAEASESVNPRTSLWTKVICHCCHLITIPTYLEQGRPIISVTVTSSDRRGSRALCEGRAVGMQGPFVLRESTAGLWHRAC